MRRLLTVFILGCSAVLAQPVAYTFGTYGTNGATSGLNSITYNGNTYATNVHANRLGLTTFSSGNTYGSGSSIYGHSGTSTANSATVIYQPAGSGNTLDQLTISLTGSLPSSTSMRLDVAITNNDGSDTLTGISTYDLLDLALPSAATQYSTSGNLLVVQNNYQAPIIYLSNGVSAPAWGSMAITLINPTVNGDLEFPYSSNGQTAFGGQMYFPCKRGVLQPVTPLAVGPGQTYTMSLLLQFAATILPPAQLAATGMATFNSAYPFLAGRANHNPILPVFVAAGATDYSHHSATNPRGYFTDPTLNSVNCSVTNASACTAMLAEAKTFADAMIAEANAQPYRPQGFLFWDLDGTEFNPVTSYVGHPSLIQYYSPDGLVLADYLVGRAHAAGYDVGFAHRPNSIGVGDTLPATCTTNATQDLQDVFILTSASWPNRGYACSSANTWTKTVINWQEFPATMTALDVQMETDIAYEVNRWNAKWDYTDSFVGSNGNILTAAAWAKVIADYPGMMFFPEETTEAAFGYTPPFLSGTNLGQWSTANRFPTATIAYPGAYSFVYGVGVITTGLSGTNGLLRVGYTSGLTLTGTGACPLTAFDGGGSGGTATLSVSSGVAGSIVITARGSGYTTTPTTATVGSCTGTATSSGTPALSVTTTGTVVTGIARGDIIGYAGWYHAGDDTFFNTLISQACAQNSVMSVTDTNTSSTLTYYGSPCSIMPYPVVMREYYADTAADLPTSTTYCEMRGTPQCYQSGAWTGGSTVNLSGLSASQVRYYDFAGNYVSGPQNVFNFGIFSGTIH